MTTLADTSAWIEFDRATGSAVDRRMLELLRAGGAVAGTEPVLMELLAGTNSDEGASYVRNLLGSVEWIPADAAADFEGAANVYRKCRIAGVSPRGLVDCVIAAIALRADVPVLTADRDFAAIASVLPLRIDPASSGTAGPR